MTLQHARAGGLAVAALVGGGQMAVVIWPCAFARSFARHRMLERLNGVRAAWLVVVRRHPSPRDWRMGSTHTSTSASHATRAVRRDMCLSARADATCINEAVVFAYSDREARLGDSDDRKSRSFVM